MLNYYVFRYVLRLIQTCLNDENFECTLMSKVSIGPWFDVNA